MTETNASGAQVPCISLLEEVLGLRRENDTTVRCRRVNASGLGCWAYVQLEKEPMYKAERT